MGSAACEGHRSGGTGRAHLGRAPTQEPRPLHPERRALKSSLPLSAGLLSRCPCPAVDPEPCSLIPAVPARTAGTASTRRGCQMRLDSVALWMPPWRRTGAGEPPHMKRFGVAATVVPIH